MAGIKKGCGRDIPSTVFLSLFYNFEISSTESSVTEAIVSRSIPFESIFLAIFISLSC